MSNEINPGQETLFATDPVVNIDLAEYAGYIAEHASQFVPPNNYGVHEAVTGVKPGAADVTVHGPGSPDWDAMRSRVG